MSRKRSSPSGPPVPGSVWWCDGAALSFEALFKRRPVLVIAIEGTSAHVMPLSSKRRYGQEQAVTHEGGVSFMTGAILQVPLSALQQSLGVWPGFVEWRAEQERIATAMEESRARRERWMNWLRHLFTWLR